MNHDIMLNIHYSAPEEIWEKFIDVCRNMPYWGESEDDIHWVGEKIYLEYSLEPGGVQISGKMPNKIWNEWYSTFKARLTEALGYEIGEPEEGCQFKYWTPFEKKYSDIKSIDEIKISFNDHTAFYWNQFDSTERNLLAKPPYFLFKSEYIELWVIFSDVSQKANKKSFLEFQKRLEDAGVETWKIS